MRLGPAELVIILVLALIIVGPGKLPDVGRSIGQAISGFRKATKDVDKEIKEAVEDVTDATKLS